MRRGFLRVAVILGMSGCGAAADCRADDGGAQSGPRVEITEPAAESIVGGRFRVSGRVVVSPGKTDPPILRVNGTDVAIVDGKWSLESSPAKDGVFRIRVVCAYPGEPATIVEVPVKVDRTPPSIEFSEPVAEYGVYPDGEGRIAGVVADANLVRLSINGKDVEVTRQGEFEETFLLPAAGETRVEVRAIDAAGNESVGVRRLTTVRDSSAPPMGAAPTAPKPKSKPPPKEQPPPPPDAPSPVREAARWLLAHQSPDGGWECEGFRRWCDGQPAPSQGPDGAGKAMYDVGITGLAVLALLGASEGTLGRDAEAVHKAADRGLRFLRNSQDTEGCFGQRLTSHYVYNHGIASSAMVEAYATTGNPAHRVSAQKALDFIAYARNPAAAWRYGVRPGDNDTSVTGWMMMAMATAKRANATDAKAGREHSFVVDETAFEGIKVWMDAVTDEKGRAGYQTRGTGPARMTDLVDKFPAEKSESMTAICVLGRLMFVANASTSQAVRKGADLCISHLPAWNTMDGSIDFYYWYYATKALNRLGGPWRDTWNRALATAVVPRQMVNGDYCDYRGSWDPLDPWGADGGRVYSTAILALALETAGAEAATLRPEPAVPDSAPTAGAAPPELRSRVAKFMLAREGLIDTCGECGGTGKRAQRVPGGYDYVPCRACSGKGKVLDRIRFRTAYWTLKSPAWRDSYTNKLQFEQMLLDRAADLTKVAALRRHSIKSIVLVGDRNAVATVIEDGNTTQSLWIRYEAVGAEPAGWFLYDAGADGPWPP